MSSSNEVCIVIISIYILITVHIKTNSTSKVFIRLKLDVLMVISDFATRMLISNVSFISREV